MKPAQTFLRIVIAIVAIIIAWNIIKVLIAVVSGVLYFAIGFAIIGGLGWAILRLLGRKSINSRKTPMLP